MKRLFYILAAFIVAACSKEMNAPEENNPVSGDRRTSGEVTVIGACIDNEDTKTSFGPAVDHSYPILWADTDAISVNGTASTAIVVDGGDRQQASFTIGGPVTAPYCAVYPLSAYVADSYDASSKTMDITIPASQTYSAGQYDSAAAIMLAYSESEGSMSFHQAAGYYKFSFTGSADTDNIKTVKIRKADGGNIAGTYTATFSGSLCSLAENDVTGVITVDCGVNGVAQGTEITIVLPAINFTGGLIVTAFDVNGHFHSYGTGAVDFATAKRGKILKKALIYNPQSGSISSAADWEDFAAQFNAGDLYKYVGNGTVVLANDITANTYTMLDGVFKYTFDGNGHTITMNAGQNSLFKNLGTGGVIKRLVTDGTVVNGTTSLGTTVLACSIAGGAIRDCINNADIEVSGVTDHLSAAAFGRQGSGSSVIERCENNGDITISCTYTSATKNAYVGGFVARVNGEFTMTDCKNTGDITISITNTGQQVGYAGFGGMVGWCNRDDSKYPEIHFTNCDNEGNITVSTTDSSKEYPVCIGGILGTGWGDYDSTNHVSTKLGVPSKTENQNKIFFEDCDNSGILNNRAISYCAVQKLIGKSFTGGIAGSMFGFVSVFNDETQPIFDGCTSSGNIIPYDNDGTGASNRAGLESVCGGLVGLGANVSFKDCIVTAQVGTTKRLAFAVSGGIGVASGKFRFDGCTFCPQIIMPRCYNTARDNWSLIASSPKKAGTTSCNNTMNFSGGANPSVNGSVVKNCTLGAPGPKLNSPTVAWNATTATVSTIGTKFNNLTNCETFAVQGTNYDSDFAVYCAKTTGDVTFTNNSYSSSVPSPIGTPVNPPVMP